MNMTPKQISDKLASQLQAGQFAAAAKLAKTALKKFPRESHFANVAGTALANADRGREALAYFVKAVKLEPDHEEYQNNLVHGYIVTSNHDKVDALVQKFAASRKDPSKLYYLQAFSAKLRSRHPLVIEAATKGLTTATDMRPDLLMARGEAYGGRGEFTLAKADYLQLLSLQPHNAEATDKLAALYLDHFQPQKALEIIDQSLVVFPDETRLLNARAGALAALGQVGATQEIFKRILEIDPYNAPALESLAKSAKGSDINDLLPITITAMNKHAKGTDSWSHLAMAVGNLHYSAKNFGAAGSFLAKGNAGLSKLFVHHQDREEAAFVETVARTPAGPATIRPTRVGQPQLLCVLGQPRSGTTLTEMVLSAHPDVASCGELSAISNASRQYLEGDTPFDAECFENMYRANVPSHALNSAAFVDKMPANYRYVGLILHGIAGAKIIHIERDPRDVALSMWRQVFKTEWMRFTNDLKSMAQQANLYRRYMNHWKAQFGDQLLTIRYDDLVANIEGVSKTMADYCGLEWAEAMMAPQSNKAQVRTASVAQVRQGVHQQSVGGWRRLESALQPFNKALDPALWPELDLRKSK